MRKSTQLTPSRRRRALDVQGTGEVRRRLCGVMAELQRARLALHEICHAVSVYESELNVMRQDRERVALQVAALAELVEGLERDLKRNASDR